MARTFFRGQIVGEPDPVTPTIDWVRSELDFARSIKQGPNLLDRGCLNARICCLKEVLRHMEREDEVLQES